MAAPLFTAFLYYQMCSNSRPCIQGGTISSTSTANPQMLVDEWQVLPGLLQGILVVSDSSRLRKGVLAYKCGPIFAGLTGATLAAYTIFTFSFTQVSFSTTSAPTRLTTSSALQSVTCCMVCYPAEMLHKASTFPARKDDLDWRLILTM